MRGPGENGGPRRIRILRRQRVILVAAAALVLTNCGSGDDASTTAGASTTTEAPTSTSTTTSTGTSAPTTSTSTTTPPSPAPTTATSPTATSAPAPDPPPEPTGGVDPARLPASWRAGCPVGPEDLELLAVEYVGFDGAVHTGELVVHADVAADVASVFRTLLDARYPIERMELVDVYGGSDDASTMANNTSAFNCRAITGGSRWSQHSYGRAIDINPLQNPYVYRDGHVLDPAAARFTDRSLQEPGMIHPGDVVVSAFAAIGWEWGGNYNSIKDYQHFSETGG